MRLYGLRSVLRTCVFVFLLFLAGLPSLIQAKGPKGIDLAGRTRVALLVCRMGTPDGILKEITPETDYSIIAAGGKQSLCVEDEAKLRAAFPEYPLMHKGRVPKIENSFYRNLTQPLTSLLGEILREKGKTVVSIRELAAGWPGPPESQSLRSILSRLRDQADALLVVHYTDGANSLFDAINVARIDHGFSSLTVQLALFDIAGGQRLSRAEMSFNPMAILSVDPDQKAHVEVTEGAAKDAAFEQGFLIKERRGLFFSRCTLTKILCPPEAVQERALHYLRKGYDGPSSMHRFNGLDKLIQ